MKRKLIGLLKSLQRKLWACLYVIGVRGMGVITSGVIFRRMWHDALDTNWHKHNVNMTNRKMVVRLMEKSSYGCNWI